MIKLQFKIEIHAPISHVYDTMLWITSKVTYEKWTYLFNPTSTFEGSWNKGDKILFIWFDEKWEKGGMVSRIVENITNKFVSIQHYGLLKGNQEVTQGPDVEKWANWFENYTFDENEGKTIITIDLETADDFVNYMNDSYPKALKKLKEICE